MSIELKFCSMKIHVLCMLVLSVLLVGCSQQSAPVQGSSTASPSPQETPPKNLDEVPVSSLAWLLGKDYSQAAIMKSRSVPGPEFEKAFELCSKVAIRLEVGAVPPPPEPSENASENLGATLAYILESSKSLSESLKAKHGERAAGIFEIAWKTNTSALLYAPGDQLALGYATQLESAGKAYKLPAELWQPVVTSIRANESAEVVRGLIAKMSTEMPIKLAESELVEEENKTSK